MWELGGSHDGLGLGLQEGPKKVVVLPCLFVWRAHKEEGSEWGPGGDDETMHDEPRPLAVEQKLDQVDP